MPGNAGASWRSCSSLTVARLLEIILPKAADKPLALGAGSWPESRVKCPYMAEPTFPGALPKRALRAEGLVIEGDLGVAALHAQMNLDGRQRVVEGHS